MRTEIIYEDAELLVAYKSAGLATQSGKVGQADMVSELKKYLARQAKTPGKEPYLGLVHRLDQPVEGLLVFGKTKSATAALSAQLSKDILNKTYLALVYGAERTQRKGLAVHLEDYMIKDDGNVARIVDGEKGETGSSKLEKENVKKAILTYESLKTLDVSPFLCEGCSTEIEKHDLNVTLIRVELTTGRFHQIRCQMAHAGFPLIGDQKYGNERSLELSKLLGVKNVCLCASTITFKHPKTGKIMNFEIKPKNPMYKEFI